MKYLKNKKHTTKHRALVMLLISVVLTIGAFVTAEENTTIADAAGNAAIDALVKSILEGTDTQDVKTNAASNAADVQSAVKAPKRAILMDDDEILEAVEMVGDPADGVAIQEITFNKEMTIADALRFLALKFKKNIVPSPNVDGMITVTKLYNVSFEQALKAVVGNNIYEADGDFIRIYTPEEYRGDTERMVHEVITLHYITASEAQSLVTPVLSSSGAIAATSPSLLDTQPGSGGDTLVVQDAIVVQDYPDIIKKAKEIIAEVDVAPQQILLEVTILEATLTETTKFGIDFDILGVTNSLGDEGIQQSGLLDTVSKGLKVGIVEDKVRVLIEAIETVGDTTILANPKILALNKQAGKLLIGDEKGYQTVSQITDGGEVIQEISFLESGTKLEFRPFICNNDYIRMEIYPEKSEGFVEDGLPRKTTTTIQSNVMVKDGKTIVIGGLFKEQTSLTRNQIPILGDAPIVGDLFRGTSDESIRTELIVLITPHIIKDPVQTDGDARMADIQRIKYGARKDLTWMSRARISEDRYKKAVEYYLAGDFDAAMSQLNSIWTIKRTFLDADRLKDKIVEETQPQNVDRIEWIMLDLIERSESQKWLR